MTTAQQQYAGPGQWAESAGPMVEGPGGTLLPASPPGDWHDPRLDQIRAGAPDFAARLTERAAGSAKARRLLRESLREAEKALAKVRQDLDFVDETLDGQAPDDTPPEPEDVPTIRKRQR